MLRRLSVLLPVLLCVFLPTPAAAQANACDPSAPARAVPYAPPTSAVAFTSAMHASMQPDGTTPMIADYIGELLIQGTTTVVANWTIPKTDMVFQPGSPQNCYRLVVPAFTGLLPANQYVYRVAARGVGGNAVSAPSTDRFFLPGAPAAPSELRIVQIP